MFQPGPMLKFVEPNALAVVWQDVALTSLAWTINMRPCVDVGSVDKYVHSNIPLVKFFVPFECRICTKRRANN